MSNLHLKEQFGLDFLFMQAIIWNNLILADFLEVFPRVISVEFVIVNTMILTQSEYDAITVDMEEVQNIEMTVTDDNLFDVTPLNGKISLKEMPFYLNSYKLPTPSSLSITPSTTRTTLPSHLLCHLPSIFSHHLYKL